MISVEAVEEGQKFLLEFCTRFQELYGSHRVTPKGAVARGRVPSQKIAQLSLNKSQEDIFYTNT